ncbi:hypothetical protein EVAR_47843_1 [Eumeta japonica]|uniref:Uncharacterized protein n=1 Tax=Eumeta variegata TaxID=151549 RepID=A0A4C1XWI2_EUMVA|nr:hypothetical protein EVAR_47843_1 [Eumeta japonica]
MSDFQGLMMEPEDKHRNSIMKQRILAVFGLVEIVLRCTVTMNDFQGLMMQSLITELEVWKLHRQTLKVNRGQNPGQFQQAQIWDQLDHRFAKLPKLCDSDTTSCADALSQAMLSVADDTFPLKKHCVVGIPSPPW